MVRPLRSLIRIIFLALAAFLAIPGCANGSPNHEVLVQRVIDGDTVQLSDGRLVRYIGIDTPEMRRKVGDVWKLEPEPFAQEATEANRRLVEGRKVRLEYDAQTQDRFGRLLAYVYVNGTLVNEYLLEEGYAHPITIPPNVRFAPRFQAMSRKARAEHKGLWKLGEEN